MKAGKKKLFPKVFFIIIVLLLLSFIGYFVFQKMDKIVMPEADYELVIPETSIKVSVINGCGFPGIATKVKDDLVKKGMIDVISWKNNTRNMFIYNQTVILAKHDDPVKLAYLQHLTGISHRAYVFDKNSIADFYIVLGNDYQKYFE